MGGDEASVSVEGRVGRRSAFEVEVNGVEVHSKLKTMGFPDLEEVAKIVQETARGQQPRQVMRLENRKLERDTFTDLRRGK